MRPKELVESNNREAEALKEGWNRQIFDCEKKLEEIRKLGSEQYLKYRMGEMEEEGFKKAKEENDKRIESLRQKSAAVTDRLRRMDSETIRKNHFLRTLVKGNEKSELTAEVVRTLIERIEVYPDHRVRVIFAFKRKDVLTGKGDI